MIFLFPAAFAATPIDRTLDVPPDAVVAISVDCGSLRVVAGAGTAVRVLGTVEGDGTFDAALASGRATLKALAGTHRHDDEVDCSELTVTVPPAATVDVVTTAADVLLQGLGGKASVQTVSGDVVVMGAPSALEARTVSGDVVVEGLVLRLDASTVDGDVVLRGVGGAVKLATVSGDLELAGGGPLTDVQATSVSGDVGIDGVLVPGGGLEAASHSGDVAVRLPADTDAQITLSSFSGEVVNGLCSQGGRTATLGAGRGRVELSAFSGDVSLSVR